MSLDRALVLVAGYPGTGKSRFCDLVRERFPQFRTISIDAIKESAFDRLGFDGPIQKQQVEEQALGEYFGQLEQTMASGAPIISEHPFSQKQRPRLALLAGKYDYRPVTIRFVADLDVLFERQHRRDLDLSRHPGHILTTYRAGDQPQNRATAEGILSWEEFERRCRSRGYGDFSLGRLVQVDTTDFGKVDYNELLERLTIELGGL